MIHRYWCGPDEPKIDSEVWHDSDLPPEIVNWCDERMNQVKKIDYLRHRSNMVRWWLLVANGGTWLDHDAKLIEKPSFISWVAVYRNQPLSCAICLPPNHQLAWNMLEHIENQPASNLACPWVSGTYVLSDLITSFTDIQRIPIDNSWLTHQWVTSKERRKNEGK